MPDSYTELNYHAQLLRQVAAGNLTLEEADRLALQRRKEKDAENFGEREEDQVGDRWDGLS